MSQFFEYTDSGIRFKGFQNLRQTLVDAWKATFGEGLDTTPTSPDGHHIDLEAATVNSIAEMLQAVANTMNRQNATGAYLDMLAAFLGLQRGEDETDASLRKRMDEADNSGLAVYDGMLKYLRNTLGKDVDMRENFEPTVDADGLPGHSFRVIVPSTNQHTDNEIAQSIWECKGNGITPDGNSSGYATDFVGRRHLIRFSRPSPVGIYVNVVLSLYNEESFPEGGTGAVKEAIEAWATGTGPWANPEYTPGKDVIPERFYRPIFTVPGIESAVIQVKKSTGSWQTTTIPISSQEIAELDVSVSVAGTT